MAVAASQDLQTSYMSVRNAPGLDFIAFKHGVDESDMAYRAPNRHDRSSICVLVSKMLRCELPECGGLVFCQKMFMEKGAIDCTGARLFLASPAKGECTNTVLSVL
jgi:hypothetical protein